MNYGLNSVACALQEYGSQIFLNTLSKIHGVKDLILAESILVQLDAICGMQKLRQNAVDKVFGLKSTHITSETKNRVYVIRPIIEELRLLAYQINNYLNKEDISVPTDDVDIKFWIVFVPSMPYFCDITLEEEGIYEYVTILECPLTLVPLESDLYSLEDEKLFKTLFLHKDLTPLNEVVSSITQLQNICGQIPQILGQGPYAKIVADRVVRKSVANTSNGDSFNNAKEDVPCLGDNNPSFTHLFLFDRDCDYASILLSQINYEGILDESFNICCNKIEYTNKVDASNPTVIKHTLTRESDPIFRDIRDMHFSTVFSLLKTRSSEMKEKYHKSREDLANLKQFVTTELKNLQLGYKAINFHLGASEQIIAHRGKYSFNELITNEGNLIDGSDNGDCLTYVTSLINNELDEYLPLKLLSLLSLTQGGLLPKDYKKFRSIYCERFGLLANEVFENLAKLDILTEMDLSLSNLMGVKGANNQTTNVTTKQSSSSAFASITGALSSLTEAASGKVVSAVTSSVLARKGNLTNVIKRFSLVPPQYPEGYNIREPKDPAFVFGGIYIPLICQLVDLLILRTKDNQQTNRILQDGLKFLPKPNFSIRQNNTTNLADKRKSLLIYFIGGVSFAEVTALRFVAKKSGISITIASSSITNYTRLINCLSIDDTGLTK